MRKFKDKLLMATNYNSLRPESIQYKLGQEHVDVTDISVDLFFITEEINA